MLPLATPIDYLDDHAGAFTALLTVVLILVTSYYALQNRRMVGELTKTRELSVLPKLALDFLRLGPTAMDVAIKNVGPGPALDIDVTIRFEPGEGSAAAIEERRWRQSILAPGEQKDFLPPGGLDGNLNTLPAQFARIVLEGSMRDATGAKHDVEEAFDDLPEWREVLHAARERFVGLPERELAQAFEKRFERHLRDLNRHLGAIGNGLNRLAPQPDPWDDTSEREQAHLEEKEPPGAEE